MDIPCDIYVRISNNLIIHGFLLITMKMISENVKHSFQEANIKKLKNTDKNKNSLLFRKLFESISFLYIKFILKIIDCLTKRERFSTSELIQNVKIIESIEKAICTNSVRIKL